MSNDLPESFYIEETRCNYLISSKQKKIWAVQLDLLTTFAQVCEKNNLRYYLDGGTLLGAVRHKGFIPWDDDVDVLMPREDYDKLCKIAPRVFKKPYFFQTSLTEKALFRAHGQLRNSNTTGCIKEDKNKDINRGIFLDVFILDNIPDSPLEKRIYRILINFFMSLLRQAYDADINSANVMKRGIIKLYHAILRVIPFHIQFLFFDQKILALYSKVNTALVGDLTLGWRENVHWKKEWFNDYEYCEFETLLLRIPSGYHEILQKQYGDYMKIPDSANLPHTMHGELILEPDIPYSEYFTK